MGYVTNILLAGEVPTLHHGFPHTGLLFLEVKS